MTISTNSVIHFTDKFENLKGIIESKAFKIKYCSEETYLDNKFSMDCAYPMCSFCDIPLSEIKNHIDSYGSYGIGLTKTWAKRSGLNPVLYIEQNSQLSKFLLKEALRIYELSKKGSPDIEQIDEFMMYMSHCKNYEGNLKKGKVNSDSYRFYDEREWRYIVPEEELKSAAPFITIDDYKKDKDSFNERLKDCRLNFQTTDISYIIIDSEDEIPDVLKVINDTFEDSITAKELKILSTKILTKNQIWNDI